MRIFRKYKVFQTTILVVYIMAISSNGLGVTVIGVLPVNTSQTNPNLINTQQLQSLSFLMHDFFTVHLSEIGVAKKLTNELILLLLKEKSVSDTENLASEDYKIISRKENLEYLLKCSVVLAKHEKKIFMSIQLFIIEGSSGKYFWEETANLSKVISEREITDDLIFKKLFKPNASGIINEIANLNF